MGVSTEAILDTYPDIKNDANLTVYIELAKTQTSSRFYGSRYNEAVALRAAHNLVMSNPVKYLNYMSGGIVGKEVEEQRIQYGRASGDNNSDKTTLSQTQFGKQLLAIMRMSNTTMGVTGPAIFGV